MNLNATMWCAGREYLAVTGLARPLSVTGGGAAKRALLRYRNPRIRVRSLRFLALAALATLAHAQTVTSTIAVGTGPQSVALNPITDKLYVANTGSNNVTVIDGATGNSTAVVTGTSPLAVAVNPVTNKVYVSNSGSNNVTVIDGVTNNTTSVAVGTNPGSLAVNPVTNKVYVTNLNSRFVTVIDGSTNTTTPATAGTGSVSVAVNPVTNKIYVANEISNNVTVIDGATNNSATVPAGLSPRFVAVNAVTNKIYVANYGSNNVTVIDGVTNSTTTVTAGSAPYSLAVNTVNNKIYVANLQSNNLTVIDGGTNNTVVVPVGSGPLSVAVNPVNNKIYVANGSGSSVTVVDGATNNTTTLATQVGPWVLAVNPVTNRIYLVNNFLGPQCVVTVIDGATDNTTTLAAGNFPNSVAVNPVTNKIYIANGDQTITLIDGATNTTTTVAVGANSQDVAVNPVTNKIYVANSNSSSVTVIDGVTNNTTTVATGFYPAALAVNPVTNQIYVANEATNNVTVIDGATNSTTTVATGTEPRSVAVNPATNKIYVVNQNSNNVTVIDGLTNNTTTVPVGTSPVSLAVNPVTNKIYVANAGPQNPVYSGTVTVIDGGTNNTTTVTAGSEPWTLAVNSVTNKIYVANLNSANVTVIDGATGNATNIPTGAAPNGVAVNPVTNKIYVTNAQSNDVAVIDGITNSVTFLNTGSSPGPVGVNPITNQIYVANEQGNNVTVIDEQQVQSIPLTTSITPLPGNQTSNPTPTFTFNTLSSTVTTPQQVFFQVDTWQNTWIAATGSNPSFTGTLTALQPGFHILYAFAVDGQQATSTEPGSPLTGAMQAYGFLVAQSAQTSAVTGETLGTLRNNYSGQVGMEFTVGSSPITLTALGRFVAPGNSQSHLLTLVNAATGQVAATATLNLSNSTPGQFQYANLTSSLLLAANSVWILVSNEIAGGDQWYDFGPVETRGATVNGPIYADASSHYVLVAAPGASYVPVSFNFLPGASSPPTVAITSPVSGTSVSGTISLTATASAVQGLTIASVQFKLNGGNIGSLITSPPYTTNLNTATLTSGTYTLTASAVDSGGNAATSAPVQITVSGGNPATPFLSGQPAAALRNNYSGFVGMQFATGATSISVSQLGRYVVSGNSQSHLLKLVNANGTDVAGGSVTLSLNGAPAGGYAYALLASPVTLAANNIYYLVSQEVGGGDQWYDIGPVTGTNAATVKGPVYSDIHGAYQLVVLSPPSQSYVPVNFLYAAAAAGPTVSIISPAAGPVSGVINLTASAAAASGLSIAGVQFQLNGNNVGPLLAASPYTTPLDTTTLGAATYSLTAIATDSYGDSATSAAVPISVSGTPSATPFLSGQPQANLRNNYSGFVGMYFTTGSVSITVAQLGRYVVAGNRQSHIVKLVSNNTDVASVTLSLQGATPGQYAYAPLSSTVTLQANTTYLLVSQEFNGGDQWYDIGPVTGTAIGVIKGPVYSDFTGAYIELGSSYLGNSYVPANFQYVPAATGTPSVVTVTTQLNGSTATATAATTKGSITSVQFMVDGFPLYSPITSPPYTLAIPSLNYGNHQITAMAQDSFGSTGTSSPVEDDVVCAQCISNPSAGFALESVINFAPTTLRNNYTGWVGFQFTTGPTLTYSAGNSMSTVALNCVAGDNQPHLVKLVLASTGTDVPGGAMWLNLATGCQHAAIFVPVPVILSPQTTYYLVIQETSGGDQWYDISPATPTPYYGGSTTTSLPANFTIDGPVYWTGSKYVLVPLANNSYVGLLFAGYVTLI